MRRPKEELFRKTNDKQLESQTKPEIWLCEIAPGSPSAEDVCHRTCAKDKFERRGKLEIFKRVKQRILTMLRRLESRINN
jgi:hypothetical protein